MPNVQVDLADPQDIAEQLPAIRQAREQARAAHQLAADTLNYWDDLIETLEARLRKAGLLETPPPRSKAKENGAKLRRAQGGRDSARARAVEIVNEIGVPVGIGDVANRMPDVKRATVQWALWDASRRNQLEAQGNGIYAPLGALSRLVLAPDDEDGP